MKRTITFLGTLACVFGLNMANGQAFESDMSNWSGGNPNGWGGSTTNASTIAEITAGVTYGTSSLQIENTTTSHQRYTTLPFTVVDGQLYDVKVWAKGNAELRTSYYDDANGSYTSYTNYQTVNSTSLTQFDYTISVSGTTSIQLILSSRSTVAPDHLIIDSVAVEASSATASNKSIYEIQYTTASPAASPEVGNLVATGGIVTATYSDGYWIQDNDGAWHGLYVDDNTNTPAIGDSITLEGLVEESFDNTQLTSVSNFNIFSSSNTVYAPTVISTNDHATEEMYEGVLVKVENAEVTSTTNQYGEWEVDDNSGATTIDDEIFQYSPTLADVYNITGVTNFSYSLYRIQPRDANDIELVSGSGPSSNSIYSIQYTTAQSGDSPLDGSTVNTGGIVTATSTDGYWIQDNEGAWHGIYVYDNNNAPAVGDSITLSGTVDEYNNLTELTFVSNFNIVSNGNTLPNPTVVTVAESNMEDYEGVFVRLEEVTCSDDNAANGNWEVEKAGSTMLIGRIIHEYTNRVFGNMYNIQGIAHFPYSERQLLVRNDNDVELVSEASIKENTLSFDVYPNPAQNIVTVNTVPNANIEMISVSGAVVKTVQTSNGVTNLDVNELPAGVYFVKVTADNFTATEKVIVK